MEKETTKTLYAVKKTLEESPKVPFTYKLRQELDYFCLSESCDPRYEEPFLSIQNTYLDTLLSEANILLISAAGATGKSILAKHLSNYFKAPIYNLAKCESIASNSLTGLLFKSLEMNDCLHFINDLKSGKAMIIIDALDEGYIKTTANGYNAFLDDVVTLTSQTGCTFIMLGRTSMIDQTSYLLEEKGQKVAHLQIEPFSLTQAESFIDKQIENSAINIKSPIYRECRKLITSAIEGFFASQADLKKRQSARFLGYAPVLLAIAAYFNRQQNLIKTRNELQDKGTRDVAMIIDITKEIMRRDREDKIHELLKDLYEDREDSFKEHVKNTVYTDTEQCARVLYYCLKKDYSKPVTSDKYFDEEYNKRMESWIPDHPFLDGRKMVNIVFEAYVISTLFTCPDYKQDVMRYLQHHYTHSYILFYIYYNLVGSDSTLDKDLIVYLFSSLQALDRKDTKFFMNVSSYNDSISVDQLTNNCSVIFSSSIDNETVSYNFEVAFKKDDCLNLLSDISDVLIDAPIDINVNSSKFVISAPGYIHCKSMLLCADDVFIHGNDEEETFTIEADNFDFVQYTSNKQILTHNISDYSQPLKIITNQIISYPFVDYVQNTPKDIEVTDDMLEAFHKCRKTIFLFRGHSKGDLARYKEMIDNLVGNTILGKAVIDALVAQGVLYEKGCMYFINDDKMAEVFGCKYDGIKNMDSFRPQTKMFLADIVSSVNNN